MKTWNVTSIEEAVAALIAIPGSVLLAGGTDLMVQVNLQQFRPPSVVSLRRVDELNDLSSDRIGAGVTWRRLEGSSHRGLAQIARTVGSVQIRNAGTIGGNIGTGSPAGDGLSWLAAADAAIEVESASGSRTIGWRDFFRGARETALSESEIVTSVVVPDGVPKRQEFAKVGVRNSMVISLVSCCVMLGDDGDWRIALGSVAPTPIRATMAEQLLRGRSTVTTSLLDELEQLVVSEVRPITDHRATETYRRRAAGVLSRRLVERILER